MTRPPLNHPFLIDNVVGCPTPEMRDNERRPR